MKEHVTRFIVAHRTVLDCRHAEAWRTPTRPRQPRAPSMPSASGPEPMPWQRPTPCWLQRALPRSCRPCRPPRATRSCTPDRLLRLAVAHVAAGSAVQPHGTLPTGHGGARPSNWEVVLSLAPGNSRSSKSSSALPAAIRRPNLCPAGQPWTTSCATPALPGYGTTPGAVGKGVYRPQYRPPDARPRTSTLPRLSTDAPPGDALSPAAEAAQALEERLARAVHERRFLLLTIAPRHLLASRRRDAAALSRHASQP